MVSPIDPGKIYISLFFNRILYRSSKTVGMWIIHVFFWIHISLVDTPSGSYQIQRLNVRRDPYRLSLALLIASQNRREFLRQSCGFLYVSILWLWLIAWTSGPRCNIQLQTSFWARVRQNSRIARYTLCRQNFMRVQSVSVMHFFFALHIAVLQDVSFAGPVLMSICTECVGMSNWIDPRLSIDLYTPVARKVEHLP